MTQHTLKYIHKRRGFCKADIKTETEKTPEVKTPEPDNKPKITDDFVNDYIKQNPDIISNYLRNERAMKAQRKQLNVRSLLNNAFWNLFYFILYNKINKIFKKRYLIVTLHSSVFSVLSLLSHS